MLEPFFSHSRWYDKKEKKEMLLNGINQHSVFYKFQTERISEKNFFFTKARGYLYLFERSCTGCSILIYTIIYETICRSKNVWHVFLFLFWESSNLADFGETKVTAISSSIITICASQKKFRFHENSWLPLLSKRRCNKVFYFNP